jgi:hypothetical protein
VITVLFPAVRRDHRGVKSAGHADRERPDPPRWIVCAFLFAVVFTLYVALSATGVAGPYHPWSARSLVTEAAAALVMAVLGAYVGPRMAAIDERAALGIVRMEDWRVLDRAARRGEAPADVTLDGPLLAMVRRRRRSLRRAWVPLVVVLLIVAGLLLHPDASAVVTECLFAVLIGSVLVHNRALARRLDRLELILNERGPDDAGVGY